MVFSPEDRQARYVLLRYVKLMRNPCARVAFLSCEKKRIRLKSFCRTPSYLTFNAVRKVCVYCHKPSDDRLSGAELFDLVCQENDVALL